MTLRKKTNSSCLGGYQIEEVYDQYKSDEDTYDQIIKKLSDHFNPTNNVQLNSFTFHNMAQYPDECFDDFVSRIRTQGKLCGFTDCDVQCASQIIQRCSSDILKNEALCKNPPLTLTEVIALGRLKESVAYQVKKLKGQPADHKPCLLITYRHI